MPRVRELPKRCQNLPSPHPPHTHPAPAFPLVAGMPTDPAVIERLEKYLAAFALFLKAHRAVALV